MMESNGQMGKDMGYDHEAMDNPVIDQTGLEGKKLGIMLFYAGNFFHPDLTVNAQEIRNIFGGETAPHRRRK